eukprot:TRINITY_DN28554_c0_g1_i1.p1 TRINITY_DN28554_c0_g1~~TRINITY_DN28554_c0_g1_i1.p1  ORF type:complete len:1131 (+),score=306.21 TRINITY_DN28554_c0_g1_i1:66-3458(+)
MAACEPCYGAGANEGEDGATKSSDLLENYPNLRGLRSFEGPPPEDWVKTPLPRLPPEVTTGTLGNGLQWFVQENREPKARAELYLVVGFGSLVEDENERGIAHIIEHLGFSATKSYENHAIVKFLESIGAPFGACQNAYTSFDRTVYTLHIPTDKEGLVKESLTVLREFAYYTRISEEDLDKERKVVLEEWRESKNAQGRLFEKYLNLLCKDCKWCERLPIGTEEVIKTVSAQTLREFYRKFYHPGRMSVVAVGDFDGAAVAADIKSLFDIAPEAIEPLKREPVAPERPLHVVPDTEGIGVASSTDPELSFAQGLIDCKRPRRTPKNVSDVKRSLTEDLFHRCLSNRLLKLTLEPKGARNFFMVNTETHEPVPVLTPLSISIAPLPGRMRQSIHDIVYEIERVKRLGFHAAEVTRAKRSMLAEYEESYIERSQRPSESFAEDYVSHILDDIPVPGVKKSCEISATILPLIEPEEVQKAADAFNFDKNVVVKLATPPLSIRNLLYSIWNCFNAFRTFRLPRPSLDLPDGTELEAILKGVKKEAIEPWPADEDDPDLRLQNGFDTATKTRPADQVPPPASGQSAPHKAMREVEADAVPVPVRTEGESSPLKPITGMQPLGEEIVLRNGLRIFFKSTNLFDDEIVLRGRRWGGLSEHQSTSSMNSGVVHTEAQVASMTAMMLGICGLSVESLEESLQGKRVDPSPPNLDPYSTALEAGASPADFESLLVLLHLLFVCPVEAKAQSMGRLSLVKLGLLAWRLGEDRDPQSKFNKRVLSLLTNNHPYTRSPSLWSILRLNFSKCSTIFNERASRPAEWTFTLVGNLPAKEVLLPLLDKYLGSIPNLDRTGSTETAMACERRPELELRNAVTPLEISFPSRPVREEVRLKMIDPKGSTVLSFPIRLQHCTKLGDQKSAEDELQDLFQLKLLVKLLETRLIEVLRFKRGQVYGVSVAEDLGLSSPKVGMPREGTLSVSFECDPAESDELLEAATTELEELRTGKGSFTEDNVKASKEQARRTLEEMFLKNNWWAETVLDLYFSRMNLVCGDIGASMATWWRVHAQVVEGFSVEKASEYLRQLLPGCVQGEGSKSTRMAVVTMRPKRGWFGGGGQVTETSSSSSTGAAASPSAHSKED